MTTNPVTHNPFMDPRTDSEDNGTDRALAVEATLVVGRNASLTLGTDSLIVLGEYPALELCNLVNS
jgi:sphingosine kinase